MARELIVSGCKYVGSYHGNASSQIFSSFHVVRELKFQGCKKIAVIRHFPRGSRSVRCFVFLIVALFVDLTSFVNWDSWACLVAQALLHFPLLFYHALPSSLGMKSLFGFSRF